MINMEVNIVAKPAEINVFEYRNSYQIIIKGHKTYEYSNNIIIELDNDGLEKLKEEIERVNK